MYSVSPAISLQAMPSISNLLGTSGTNSITTLINDQFGSTSFFDSTNDIFQKGRDLFVKNFVEPIKSMAMQLKTLHKNLGLPKEDKIILLSSEEDFIDIPPCMYLPILTHEPVMDLFKQGRIFGFGYTYENVKDMEDVYGRLINNGKVEDISSAMDENGIVEFKCEYKSTDPDLTFEELDIIEQTRNYVDLLLTTTKKDPTDISSDRG